ncbi:MAG: M23 family metallopeptidase [Defluviitaleaceae bacterium]|nr:M23 family metallopeptidase [Defluviitaleaceae bacterium]
MKNTSPDTEGNIFRKKGFFIALYSCLGAVAILALVITVANFGQNGFQADNYEEDAAPVGAEQVQPYLSQVDEEAWFRPRATPEPTTTPVPTPQPSPQPPSVLPTPEPPAPATEPTPTPEPAAEAEPPPPPPPVEAFVPFGEDDQLLWPIYGDIAMPFSMNALIYDPTLDQFRTNDNLRIYAEEGAHVQASAAGRVMAIGRNVVRGNYVKIDHGNGLMAYYGQLADNKLVSQGDIVRAGQLIGTVGTPSIFGTMHGYHVNLRVTRNDEPVNPYELLAAR